VCGRRATLAIADLLIWAMANEPNLARTCRHHQHPASIVCAQSAGAQDQLLNIADVEVLFLQNLL